MSQAKNPLELFVAEKLRKLDRFSRPTKASGAGTEIGDVLNNHFYVECKMRSTKNVTIDRKVMTKLLGQRARKDKWCIYALQNQFEDKYIVMDADEFFLLATKAISNG